VSLWQAAEKAGVARLCQEDFTGHGIAGNKFRRRLNAALFPVWRQVDRDKQQVPPRGLKPLVGMAIQLGCLTAMNPGETPLYQDTPNRKLL